MSLVRIQYRPLNKNNDLGLMIGKKSRRTDLKLAKILPNSFGIQPVEAIFLSTSPPGINSTLLFAFTKDSF
jgi:hypothetical protein